MATRMGLKRLLKLVCGVGCLACATCLASCAKTTNASPRWVVQHASRGALTAFGSEAELASFLKELSSARKHEQEEHAAKGGGVLSPGAAAPPSPAAESVNGAAPSPSTDGKAEESVTNVQHAGVDEGGIVKTHGEFLVVLRRGRLFTIRASDGPLTPVASIDAFSPDINPSGTWYDEMLIGGDTIAVIGYSYERGGTEIGLFDIDGGGALHYRSTYHLRSNDYYSSRNYASRLIGNKLIFYTPLYLSLDEKDLFHSFPALRKWHRGATDQEFQRIASAMRVYRPIVASNSLALHTVTVCDLGQRELSCQATAVLGPEGRVFYVSPGSVYVWVSDWEANPQSNRSRALVYRLPLDGSAPSAMRVSGSPVDQFSFLEGGDGFLNVLVRAEAAGDGMWRAEITGGDVALMRVRVESFSSGADVVPAAGYHPLPRPNGDTFQNRFVGSYVLYGTGSGWGPPEQGVRSSVFAYPYAQGGDAVALPLVHGVDRIEALGSDAIVVGTNGQDLHFSPVSLEGRPAVAQGYVRKNASQGELRSHGFFYKPHEQHSGMLGLPIREAGRPGYEHLFSDSASILFLRNDQLRLGELGTLGARPEGAADDACRASCVDWYGNARPLFLRGRIFALLGYEIVEGELSEGKIRETRRLNFAPSLPKIAR